MRRVFVEHPKQRLCEKISMGCVARRKQTVLRDKLDEDQMAMDFSSDEYGVQAAVANGVLYDLPIPNVELAALSTSRRPAPFGRSQRDTSHGYTSLDWVLLQCCCDFSATQQWLPRHSTKCIAAMVRGRGMFK